MGDQGVKTRIGEELAGQRLDRVVAACGDLSRRVARELVESGAALVDGRPQEPAFRVPEGAMVSFELPEPDDDLRPREVRLSFLYEDEHLAVVDKPAGLVVHPGAGRAEDTLAAGLLWHRPDIEGVGRPGRWGIVHRLDRDTSGAMVVAYTQEAYAGLSRVIADHAVERRYRALVDGEFPVPTGTIDAPIGRDPHRPVRRRVTPDGRPARTHYALVRGFEEAGVSLLDVTLETGRTHQIRVHLASIDHPVVGDPLYRPGPDRVRAPRLFLHAARLSFQHPVTGREVAVESPLPDDLRAVLAELEA